MAPVDFDDARADVQAAEGVALEADRLRRALRRRTKKADPRRLDKIEEMIELIDQAMKPIRSHAGRLAWEAYPDDLAGAVPRVSAELQYHRRQLKKMRP